jgi:aspartyl-tRNA(Asn)/glutamyl-tRNA(Gln) amidotransferase subunit A
VHAFLHVDREGALAAAERVDRGEVTGPLAGVPVAVKDVIATKGRADHRRLQDPRGLAPPYDATLVERLRAAGTVMLGKTNMDEFAMGSSTNTRPTAPRTTRGTSAASPGGSGGGSAAAIAAYEAPLAIGTDTGGSIRQPGAVTGTVGANRPTAAPPGTADRLLVLARHARARAPATSRTRPCCTR